MEMQTKAKVSQRARRQRKPRVRIETGEECDVVTVEMGMESISAPLVQAAARKVLETIVTALESEERPRKRIGEQRVEPVERALQAVVGRLMHDVYSPSVTDEQLADRAQVAIDTFDVVLSEDERGLNSLIGALRAGDADDAFDPAQARARARLRTQAVYRSVLAESLTVSQLRPFKSRQRLQQLRDAGRLFAIKTPYERGLVYPTWEFDDDYDPLLVMPELIQTAREAGLSALGLHQVMTGPRARGKSGVELLAAGREDLALNLVRAADR